MPEELTDEEVRKRIEQPKPEEAKKMEEYAKRYIKAVNGDAEMTPAEMYELGAYWARPGTHEDDSFKMTAALAIYRTAAERGHKYAALQAALIYRTLDYRELCEEYYAMAKANGLEGNESIENYLNQPTSSK